MTNPPEAADIAKLAASLGERERETLRAWRDCAVGYGFGFDTAAKLCDTPRRYIRTAVRSLARKGLLEYARALYWEDEPKMGAGYTLTKAGSEALSKLDCFVCGECAITELDGDALCQRHADAWVRSEGEAAREREQAA